MSKKSCPVARVVEILTVICAVAPCAYPTRKVYDPQVLNGLSIPFDGIDSLVVPLAYIPGSVG
jgi:hypothetical protein